MSPERQFWLNWLVQFAVAVATFAAVVVALFGSYLRARFWPPKIKLTPKGIGDKPVPTVLKASDGQTENTASWWCHLLVENLRPWSPARDLRVQILRLETPDSGGQFQLEWAGEGIPLVWAPQLYKPITTTIPPSDVVDLFSVHKTSRLGGPAALKIHPLFRSFELRADWTEACKIAIVVQAKSPDGRLIAFTHRNILGWKVVR